MNAKTNKKWGRKKRTANKKANDISLLKREWRTEKWQSLEG